MKNLLRFPRSSPWAHQPDVSALSAQLDGELDAGASARLDAHVASCDACRVALAGLGETRSMLRAVPEAAAPRSFRLRVADTVPETRRSPLRTWAPAAGALAAVVVAVVVGVSLNTGGGSSSLQSAKSNTQNAPAAGPALDSSGADMSIITPAVPRPEGAIVPPASATSPADGGAAAPAATPFAAQPAPGATATAGLQYEASRSTVRPTATSAAGELTAAAGKAEGDGNNSTALDVMEIIGVAAAVVAAVIGIRWWRRRGETP